VAALTASIANQNPTFIFRRTSPSSLDLITGLLPILNLNLTLLTVRALLGNGSVTLCGEVELTAGDVIGLFYNADGLSLNLNLGGNNSGGIVWSAHRMT
jgi:hypothetical protein